MAGAGTFSSFASPIVIDSTNKVIRIDEMGGAGYVDLTLAEGTHFWRGDGTANDMKQVLKNALDVLNPGAYLAYLFGNGKITITKMSVFQIDWSAALTTADAAIFGFSDAPGDNPYVATQTPPPMWYVDSPNQVGKLWLPDVQSTEDTGDIPQATVRGRTLMTGRRRVARWGSRTIRDVLLEILPSHKMFTAEESIQGEAFERFWPEVNDGTRFEYCPDFHDSASMLTNPGVRSPYVIRDHAWMEDWPVEHTGNTVRLFSLGWPMLAYVA